MKIAVIALGKIGLPLAVQFARTGFETTGVDVNAKTVDLVNSGRVPFPGEAHLSEYLSDVVQNGKLKATTEYSKAVPDADVVVVVVPLFVNDETWEPDFGWMDDATASLAANITPGTIISYETTLPVGTTRNRWKPMIERISGLKEGTDFHLVFSPERVLTGRVFEDLRRYPKLVGGLSPRGTEAGIEFYKKVLQFDPRDDLELPNGVWNMGSAEASEMAKLAETTYRDVNIGLANQFAVFADKQGIDISKVINACNSQPFSHIHQPGIAVGGHCIPVYPRLYLANDPEATIVKTARLQNAAMPKYCVSQLEQALGGHLEGKAVALLGASYRGGVKETAFSGVFKTVAELEARGATVRVHDPFYSKEELASFGWDSYEIGESVDAAVIQANHKEYAQLTPADFPGIKALFDGRRITDPDNWAKVTRLTVG